MPNRRQVFATTPEHEFRRDIRAGLARPQKEIPAQYLYDELGTTLFDAITLLPEYGLTRADLRLLDQHAPTLAGMFERLPLIVELGSGTGAKTRRILEEFRDAPELRYIPVDISRPALLKCGKELSDIARLTIVPFEGTYIRGLQHANSLRAPGTPLLLLFLGSSYGNFDQARRAGFLRQLRSHLRRGDALYLGVDLEKDTRRMLAAYHDALGVTAAFNLNVLARINRELDGDFDLRRFEHLARYDGEQHRIEMHLRSTIDQIVTVGDAFSVGLRKDETIWTESSYKFRLAEIHALAADSGFRCEAQWVDDEWPFAQNVLRPM